MTRLMIAISLLGLAACADGAIEQPHPGVNLHHPEGVCVLGEQVHVISSNHDRRYQSGAVFSYAKVSLVAGSAANTVLSLPAGFGGVLNLGACVAAAGEAAAYLLLIDRVTRTMLKVEATADGTLSCATGCLPVALGGKDDEGVMTGIRDPGRAVTLGDQLLFSSRVDEQATRYEVGGALERVGEAAASRPVVGGRWLIARSRAVALRLTEEGAQDRLVFGFDGALWGVAGTTPETGFALGRHGDLLIKFEDDGEALQSIWQQPLRNHRRRLVLAGDELLVFGGEDRVLERRSISDGRLLGLVRDLSFEETEGAASLSNGLLAVTNFRGHTLSVIDLNTGSTSVVVAAP